MDEEKVGRALLEYCGVPLALMMLSGLAARFLPQYGMEAGFLDPLTNILPFFVINFWLVIGIYVYRQKYQPTLVFTPRREMGLAALVGLTWLFTQPLLLLAGYGLFLKAVWEKDSISPFLHSSLLPDLPSLEDEEETFEF